VVGGGGGGLGGGSGALQQGGGLAGWVGGWLGGWVGWWVGGWVGQVLGIPAHRGPHTRWVNSPAAATGHGKRPLHPRRFQTQLPFGFFLQPKLRKINKQVNKSTKTSEQGVEDTRASQFSPAAHYCKRQAGCHGKQPPRSHREMCDDFGKNVSVELCARGEADRQQTGCSTGFRTDNRLIYRSLGLAFPSRHISERAGKGEPRDA